MKPFLIPKTYDLSGLLTSEGPLLLSSDNLFLTVQDPDPHIPSHTGLGVLSEATSCIVTHGEGGGYDELEMEYPVSGHLFPFITNRDIIVANVERTRGNQAYRIYKIKKTIKGMVHINARHIAYDLGGIVVAPFRADSLGEALTKLRTASMTLNPFVFSTSRVSSIPFDVPIPTPVWDAMGSDEGGLISVYNGEYLFDNYNIHFEETIGEDKGVRVTYGVNMTDFEQEASCENCYTGAVGYWEKDDKVEYSSVVKAPGNYSYERLMVVDMSDRWDEKPTKDELNDVVMEYVKVNKIGVPEVSWTINFVPLDMTEEYKDIAPIQAVSLGDTVHVNFEKMGVDASARVVEIKWNVLLDRYDSVSLGDMKKNVATTLASYSSSLGSSATKEEVYDVQKYASDSISNFAQNGTISGNQVKGGELVVGGPDNQNGILKIVDSNGSIIGWIKNNGLSYSGVHSSYVRVNKNGFLIQYEAPEVNESFRTLGSFAMVDDTGIVYPSLTLYNYDLTEAQRTRTVFITGKGHLVAYDEDGEYSIRILGDERKIKMYNSDGEPTIMMDGETGEIICTDSTGTPTIILDGRTGEITCTNVINS